MVYTYEYTYKNKKIGEKMIKVNKQEMVNALKSIGGCVDSKLVPILSNVRIRIVDSKLELQTSNLDTTMTSTCDIVEGSEFDTTINYKKLLSIFNSLPNDVATIDINKEIVSIKCSSSKFKIASMSSMEWPALLGMPDYIELDVSSNNVKDLIDKVSYCVSNDDTRPIIKGILLTADNKEIKSVATDGRRLSICTQDIDTNVNFSIVVPVKPIAEFCKNTVDMVNIKISDSVIVMKSGSIAISTKLLEGNYPKYESIIPKNLDKSVNLPAIDLLNAINRVSTVLEGDDSTIQITLSNTGIIVNAGSLNSGSETINYDLDADIEFKFNSSFLTQTLSKCNTNLVELNYVDKNMPTLIKFDNLESVIMPMRG